MTEQNYRIVNVTKARAARTRTKHDRWIRELAGAGFWVVKPGDITIGARRNTVSDDLILDASCTRCDTTLREWEDGEFDVQRMSDAWAPLPQVLHAVSGHTCEEPK